MAFYGHCELVANLELVGGFCISSAFNTDRAGASPELFLTIDLMAFVQAFPSLVVLFAARLRS